MGLSLQAAGWDASRIIDVSWNWMFICGENDTDRLGWQILAMAYIRGDFIQNVSALVRNHRYYGGDDV